MIAQYSKQYSIRLMCSMLNVSASGYYAWRDRPASARAQANAELAETIKRIFDEERGRSGAVRITKLLKHEGITVSRHRVARIMKENYWRAKAARKCKVTTNSCHTLPVASNLLEQKFRPNEKWVSDITYIWTREGWLYLAVVMDLYSRMIVGWAMSKRMTSTLVCNALQMALWRRKMPKNIIVHSDRGSQYCSQAYQQLLTKNQLICSMSKRGDCYDNAAMESWNHSLKVEAIHGEEFATRREAKNHVFEYIDIYYNRKRLHSSIGYLSPVNYEAKMVA